MFLQVEHTTDYETHDDVHEYRMLLLTSHTTLRFTYIITDCEAGDEDSEAPSIFDN